MRRGGTCSVRGVTLAELIVSMAITTMLLAGIGSAILLATHAIPDGESPVETTLETAAVADQILADLRYAKTFLKREPADVEFTVADRTGDALDDTMRYLWSGTPGDPVTRQFNGGNTPAILENVEQFDLTYRVRTLAETTTNRYFVTAVDVKLRVRSDPARRIDAGTHMANEPEVPTP